MGVASLRAKVPQSCQDVVTPHGAKCFSRSQKQVHMHLSCGRWRAGLLCAMISIADRRPTENCSGPVESPRNSALARSDAVS